MKHKELESMTRECLVVAAWAIHRLPIDTWVDWTILLIDLVGAQSDVFDAIEDTLVSLHERIEERLCRGQW